VVAAALAAVATATDLLTKTKGSARSLFHWGLSDQA
jgi:hypothetical protein